MNDIINLEWGGSGVFSNITEPMEAEIYFSLGNIVTDSKSIHLPDHLAEEILQDMLIMMMEENNVTLEDTFVVITNVETNFGQLKVEGLEEVLELNDFLLSVEKMSETELNEIKASLEAFTSDITLETLKNILNLSLEGELLLFKDIKTANELGRAFLNYQGEDFTEYNPAEVEKIGMELLSNGTFTTTSYGTVKNLN